MTKYFLVNEENGTWSLPGGWCDVNVSVGDNTVKETFEEAGLTVKPVRLIAGQGQKQAQHACLRIRRNKGIYALLAYRR